MIVSKEGMIPDSAIAIDLTQKPVGNQTFFPRELDGLLRVNPGDENSVGMKVIMPDGTCVIGSAPDCKVTSPTSNGNSLYQDINVGNQTMLVGYSGAGQRVQQFSILPANAGDSLASGQWHVQIIKGSQVSRFYYQVASVSK